MPLFKKKNKEVAVGYKFEIEIMPDATYEVFSLTSEDGEEMDFIIAASVEYNGDNYSVLAPNDEDGTFIPEGLVVFKISNGSLEPVEDMKLATAMVEKVIEEAEESGYFDDAEDDDEEGAEDEDCGEDDDDDDEDED
jgi:hypothetical protein